MKTLSLVISVYNEEDALDNFFQAFQAIRPRLLWDTELIFVNDGSRDNSRIILSQIAQEHPDIKVIHFSRNFGHEAAMIAGIDHASGDGVVCMDADLQHPLECLPEIIQKFEEGFEVINMIRTENKSAGLIKKITSSLFYKCLNSLSNDVKFEENASDFFAVSSRVAEILRTNYREKNRFLRGYVQSVGFRKTTLTYIASERSGGQSHYSLRKLFQFSLNAIMTFSDLPLKLGIYASATCALLGLIVLIYTFFTFKGAPSGYATIVTLICFLFAAMFLVIGIIGEYISILFSELKDRPVYLVEQKENFDTQDMVCKGSDHTSV